MVVLGFVFVFGFVFVLGFAFVFVLRGLIGSLVGAWVETDCIDMMPARRGAKAWDWA
jgi:hypothetical protein